LTVKVGRSGLGGVARADGLWRATGEEARVPLRRHSALSYVVGIVAAAGLLMTSLSAIGLRTQLVVQPWRYLVAIALPVIAELAAICVRRGGTRYRFNWRETAFVISAFLVSPAAIVVTSVVGMAVWAALKRMSPTKFVFNTALIAVDFGLAAAAIAPAHLTGRRIDWAALFRPETMLLMAVATLAAASVSFTCSHAAVSAVGHRRFAAGFRDGAWRAWLNWLRNIVAGVAIVAALSWSPAVAVGVVGALVGVQFVTADRSAIRQERFAFHRLQEAIDQLRDVELEQLIPDATNAAVTMMRADAAEIHLFARNGYETLLRATDGRDAHVPDSDDAEHDHSMDVDLSTREGKVGELRLLFSQPVKLSAVESDCLAAFANALAVALANALKFDSIREEAYRRVRAAYQDPVTGVGNLMMLEEESRAALAHVDEGQIAAIAVIGLSRFAEVNDLLGAHAADQMLRAVADRLCSVVRSCDVVARLHGAEYVLLLRELPSEAAAEAQAELAVRSLGTAITADGLDLTVDAHTGVACAPADGVELDDLVRRARLAMYKARTSDLPVFRYVAELEPPALAQVELIRDLKTALAEHQLLLHFQPKFSMRGGYPVAAEALVRWQHPTRGMIPPVEFVPLLERCGLVGDLTRYVVDAAIAECAQWHRLGMPLSIAVNLSARNLLDEDLPRYVLSRLAHHKLPPDRLICEITETAVFSRSPIAASILDQLRAAGVELSLDDFCTGYSSLSLLRERTIDEIKIDRSFVADLGVEPRSTQIVTTLIELAHRCDIIVTAEGIETAEQQHILTTLGCDNAQGYLLARPMPADKAREFLLAAMRAAPTRTLPSAPRNRIRPSGRMLSWQDATGWAEASSE
jgi:diguanylate cyclase (GGDEF)-like protein